MANEVSEKRIITEFDHFPANVILLKLLASLNKQVVYYPNKKGYEQDRFEIEDIPIEERES